jgi:hypothetical protein
VCFRIASYALGETLSRDSETRFQWQEDCDTHLGTAPQITHPAKPRCGESSITLLTSAVRQGHPISWATLCNFATPIAPHFHTRDRGKQFHLGHFPPNIPHLLTSAPRRARPTPQNTLIREARTSVRGWRRSKEHRLRLRWWFDSQGKSAPRDGTPHIHLGTTRLSTPWQMISRRPPSHALKSLASLCHRRYRVCTEPRHMRIRVHARHPLISVSHTRRALTHDTLTRCTLTPTLRDPHRFEGWETY